MKPPPFEYIAVASTGEALAELARHGEAAKLLAGGQSLMPILNMRLGTPARLVDLNRVTELSYIEERTGGVAIGAMTRQRAAERDPLITDRVPLLAEALPWVGHTAIRNRGTIGGSLSHADPAAELPMLALLLDAELRLVSTAGARSVAARDFFRGALTVDLADGEIVTEVVLPKLPPATGWGFEEVARRSGDFALAAVAATLTLHDGAIAQARIAMTGVAQTARRAGQAEALLIGARLDRGVGEAVIEAVRARAAPDTDLHASADYRRHLFGVLAGRALAAAWRRARAAA
jgi:CO/xanthine dehydrogenase FAD-binding subunit